MPSHHILTILVFVFSTLVAYALIRPLIRWAFKNGFVVTPRDREVSIPPSVRKASHGYRIPLTGGLSILVPFMLSMLLARLVFPGLFANPEAERMFWFLLVGCVGFAVVGLIDDVRHLDYRLRFLFPVLIIAALLFFTVMGHVLVLPGGYRTDIGVFEAVVLLVWVLGLSHSVNLVDGLDGSAAGIMAIACVWLGLLIPDGNAVANVALTSLLASYIAFLAFNFHPARLFLGSTGTLFPGFAMAVLSIWPGMPGLPNHFFAYAVLVLAVPLADMALVFFIRLWHGKNPFTTDSWHIHDRVLRTGASRKQAAWVIWGLAFVCGLVAYLSFRGLLPFLMAALMVAAIVGGFYLVVMRRIRRLSH